jgi:predicted nucleic acid-binding protein
MTRSRSQTTRLNPHEARRAAKVCPDFDRCCLVNAILDGTTLVERWRRSLARTTVITDDLDGSPNAETIRFSVDGTTYAIDLAQKSREKLDKALAPFIEKATKVSSARRSPGLGSGRSSTPKATRQARPQASDDRTARKWAQATGLKVNGKPVSSRGRLHPEVRAAWVQAGKPQA